LSSANDNPKNVLVFICQILQSELSLTAGQVWISGQKRTVPPTSGMWVVVRYLSGKPFGSKTSFDDGVEFQSVNMSALIQIDIYSQDTSALERKEEVVMALGSTFAQRLQELHAFKIGRLPVAPIADTSAVEGPAIPYRFSLTVQLQYKTEKSKAVDYYSTFDFEAETEA
jgi:hypothetical protein